MIIRGQTAPSVSKGGDDVGSRARFAAAACLVASGLLAGGLGTATALADPGQTVSDDAGDPPPKTGAPGSSGGLDGAKDDDDAKDDPKEDGDLDDGDANEDAGDGEDADREGPEVPGGGDDENPPPDLGEGDPVVKPGEGEPEVPGREEEEKPHWPCCDDGDKDCGPWWPWPWPRPEPNPDDDPPKSSGGGGRPSGLPAVRPSIPIRDLPPEVVPPQAEPPDIVSTVPGAGVVTGGVAVAPVSVPVLVAVPSGAAAGAGGGAGPGGAAPALPAAPRQATAEPLPARQPLPATAGSNVAMPASTYRVGYGEYLRTAGISQIAALAVPGLAGILVLTGAGGLVGYRQAKAGHSVRTRGIARFTN